MKISAKMNFISLWIGFILFFMITEVNGDTKDHDILHLRKDDFISFVKNYNYAGIENVYERRQVIGWPCDFVCWKGRKILIPNIPNTDNEIPRKLGWDLKEYQKANPPQNTKLITKNEMMIISLKALRDNDDYIKYIRRIKEKCVPPEDECNVNFYIFDFKNFELEKRMDVHYCLEPPSYRCLEPAEGGEFELQCIKKWEEEILKEDNSLPLEFDIEIEFLKCDWSSKYDNKRPCNRIIFCDIKNYPYLKLKEKISVEHIDEDKSTFTLKFNVEKNFFKKMRTQGIWLDDIDTGVRITSASLYSSLITSHENISGSPFKLYFARTRNFTPGISELWEDSDLCENEHKIKNTDIQKIVDFIERIISSRSEETKIHLIGYADRIGGWEQNNKRLAKARAESVRVCLLERLRNSIRLEDITAEGCNERYYRNNDELNDRFVEVRIY